MEREPERRRWFLGPAYKETGRRILKDVQRDLT